MVLCLGNLATLKLCFVLMKSYVKICSWQREDACTETSPARYDVYVSSAVTTSLSAELSEQFAVKA